LSMNTLAIACRNMGQYDKAEVLLKEVFETRRGTDGPESRNTLLTMNSLALLYQAQNRDAEAEALLSQALEISQRAHPKTADTARLMNDLAENYWKQGKPQQAEPLFRSALEGRRGTAGPNHPLTAATMVSLGQMLFDQKREAEAEPLLREAVGIYEKSAPGDWRRDFSQAMLAESLARRGRTSEAAPILASSYDALMKKKGSIPLERRQVLDTVLQWKSQIH
jgi:tetratricopeptide (TPR) repeat protein